MCTALLVLAAVPIAILVRSALYRSLFLTALTALVGFVAAGTLFFSSPAQTLPLPLFVIDSVGCLYGILVTAAASAIVLMSYTYVKGLSRCDEYFLFLSLAVLGAAILLFARHFASFFLGLEIMSLSSYALIAYRKDSLGIEEAMKYLVLTGVASGFLLFGIGLLYFETGILTLAPISPSPIALLSVAMIVMGIAFKLAVAPFYLWTPDVYQGSPAPVAALIATISKGSVFVFFMRFFLATGQPSAPVVMGMAIASVLIGNLLALFQDNIKRLLAYSSIAHMGYLLLALIAIGPFAQQAIALYLIAYGSSILGIFCVLTLLSSHDDERDTLSSLHGLARHHPTLAAALALMLFSLAGLPLTAGFMGKIFILRAAISSDLWLPIAVLIVASTIGLFYYLRVIFSLFIPEERPLPKIASMGGCLALALLVVALIWFGICPDSLTVA